MRYLLFFVCVVNLLIGLAAGAGFFVAVMKGMEHQALVLAVISGACTTAALWAKERANLRG